ncbi:phosphatidate cytidylyltransferase [Deinococcus pimensis]|uniref:phosphatidate cytidylyltransferase n=1 Tax=Deinococcus pimensis TaxID=309888 RepID=UPI0004B4FEF7|nr:phosphatidate cytidylyltransferase [Deinococcus pimensis]
MESLRTRVLTSVVGFLVVLVVLWFGRVLLLPALLVLSTLALREFIGMCERQDLDVRRRSLYVGGAALLVVSHPYFQGGPWVGISWREVTLAVLLGYFLIMEVISPGERPLERVVYSVFAMLYIPWLLGFFLMLRFLPDGDSGFAYLLLPLIASFATDVGGFFFGHFFGRRKLAPEVSPGKTVEGAVGGLILSFVIVFALTRLAFVNRPWSAYDALLFSLLVSSASQLGDLAESLIKRSLRAKDSGSSLPGHGGLLDRLDALLFAVPVTYLFLTVVLGGG